MGTSSRVEELQQKFDENPRRYFAPLANELRKLGDLAQAIAICRAHLPNQPAHVSGHIVLAQALHEAGELEEAGIAFASALELDPENLIALRYMGDIARERGDRDAARAWYQRVLDADPRNYEIARMMRDLDTLPNERFAPAASPEGAEALSQAAEASQPVPPAAEAPPAAASKRVVPPPREETSPPPSAENAMPVEESEAPVAARAPKADDDDLAIDAASLESPSAELLPIDASELDAAWENAPTPAAQLSDYEAAPAQWFEGDEDPFAERPGVAEAGEGRVRMPTAEIEALFDPREAEQTPPAQAAARSDEPSEPAAPASNDRIADEVEEAFRDELSAISRESWSQQPSLMSLPPLEERQQSASSSPWPDRASASATTSNGASRETAEPEREAAHADAESSPQAEPPRRDEKFSVGRTPASAEPVQETPAPFVTETLAELYLKQGFTDEALSIYRQLLLRNPGDDTLQKRIESIEGGKSAQETVSVPESRGEGNERAAQSVRTFFGRLARRVPSRTAHSSPHGGMSGASDTSRGDAALFTAPASESDTRAAANLAAAFTREAPPAQPPRGSERDLSLDHLFRENPPPDAGPVTLDAFYAPPESAPRATSESPSDDEERAADIRQFTSWLEGLKKK